MTAPNHQPNHLKRSFDDTELGGTFASPAVMAAAVESSADNRLGPASQHSHLSTTPSSPPIQSSAISLAAPPASTPTTIEPSSLSVMSSATPPRKRAKLTEAERVAKNLEKEAKDLDKAKQKAEKEETRLRKEEEKARKDEEKRTKDAEKDKRRQEKEEQSRLKEEEKKKKEDEQEKKNKSQLRLNAFFPRPNLSMGSSTPSPVREKFSPLNSRRNSVTSIDDGDPRRGRSMSATPSKSKLFQYDRAFPSFFLHPHTTLAPHSRFERDEAGLQYTIKSVDEQLKKGTQHHFCTTFNPEEMLHLSPYKRRKLDGHQPSVKKLVEQLRGTSHNPIDLTKCQELRDTREPLKILRTINTRFLKFAEDIRPPYVGTYTRLHDPQRARKICRNPFLRALPSTDYDYDSEVEWEEPGEGEDLDSEGEEEVESEDGDDLEGFLDDEDAADGAKTLQKRRLIVGDLEPTSTGLCWEDESDSETRKDLAHYRLDVLLENQRPPINPYSTAYWQDTAPSTVPTSMRTSQSTMDPPRIPLNVIHRTNQLLPIPGIAAHAGINASQQANENATASRPPRAPRRIIPPEVLGDFKRAIEGSDLTKAGLIEILKKQFIDVGLDRFPKQSKDAIKDTLGIIAERVGTKEKDKRWVIKAEALHTL
ncbi:MAG: hypothetical protein Q9220_005784 [cf. Caloplaca sp. 1 TL-2023]